MKMKEYYEKNNVKIEKEDGVGYGTFDGDDSEFGSDYKKPTFAQTKKAIEDFLEQRGEEDFEEMNESRNRALEYKQKNEIVDNTLEIEAQVAKMKKLQQTLESNKTILEFIDGANLSIVVNGVRHSVTSQNASMEVKEFRIKEGIKKCEEEIERLKKESGMK